VEGQVQEDLYIRRRTGVPVRSVQLESPPRRLGQGRRGDIWPQRFQRHRH
jgi:hypothetical protein